MTGYCWNCATRYANSHDCAIKLEPEPSVLHAQLANQRITIEYLHARWHRERGGSR